MRGRTPLQSPPPRRPSPSGEGDGGGGGGGGEKVEVEEASVEGEADHNRLPRRLPWKEELRRKRRIPQE